jgi:hypothetical protein
MANDDLYKLFLQLLERRAALMEKSQRRRQLLEDSYRLQQFERDCDETKGWINEKLKFATDDNYLVRFIFVDNVNFLIIVLFLVVNMWNELK